MPAGHKDRLSPVDASFLVQERHASHMHVGAIMVFEGPPPGYDEFVEGLESRLHLVPRYRQKLAEPRFEMGRPFWIDDPRFNIEYHIRHSALPKPGSLDQLRHLAGRVFSQRLDRSKPLWELYLVQGLERGGAGIGTAGAQRDAGGARFGLISKTHHSMIDGIAGVDLASVLFDLDPVPREVPPPDEPWTPRPEPSQAELIAEGVKGLLRTPFSIAERGITAVQHPGPAARAARETIEALGEVAWAGLNPAPDTPLNVPIGPHRRILWVENELADFKAIKNALGGTVNDVVLSVVTGALRKFLRSRGVRTEGLELRALVPMSIRREDQRGDLGNQIAAMRGPLPVYCDDPVECLKIVRHEMQGVKESKQALGAEVIAGLENFAPPTLLAQASRLNFSTRLFNLIVTNVPGPQFPLYLQGRELQQVVPVAFLPENHALAIAIMSYNGRLDFGLLGDYDAMPDLDFVAAAIEDTTGELLRAAREQGAAAPAGAGNGRRRDGKPARAGSRSPSAQ